MSLIKYSNNTQVTGVWTPSKKTSALKAADQIDIDVVPDDITFDPNYTYSIVRAISNTKNLNEDGFERHELLGEVNGLPAANAYYGYRTFRGKNNHIDHFNDASLGSVDARYEPRGDILHSWWMEDELKEPTKMAGGIHDPIQQLTNTDSWVKLLIRNDKRKFPILCSSIEEGLVDKVSMGTEIDYSTCSICNNQATNLNEFCSHVNGMYRGQVHAAQESSPFVQAGIIKANDPMVAFELNKHLAFIEISWILDVQADPTAVTLDRIEGENGQSLRDILLAGSETSSPELKESIQKAAQFHKQKRAVEEEEPVDTESVEDKVQKPVNFQVKNQDSLNEDSEEDENTGDDQGFDYNSTPDQQEGEFYPQYPFPCSALKSASEANPDENLDITIDVEACHMCMYNNSNKVGAVDCQFPKIVRPGGYDILPTGYGPPEDIDPSYNSSGFLNEDGSLISDFPNLNHPPGKGRTSSKNDPITDAHWEE